MIEISEDLVRRLDVPGPRYTSYPTVPDWSEAFGLPEYAAALRRAGDAEPTRPLSLYVHIPFCREMCSYCGCNVVVTRDPKRADDYIVAVAEEADRVAQLLGARRRVSRVHLGGGTPTFLDERQLASLWYALRPFIVEPGAEVAVEINPVVTRRSQLELLAGLGFNRISMGVQDFDPEVQAAIRRPQTVEETRALVDAARELGFRSVNLDVIYGLPRQTEASFRHTMSLVAALRPDRVAAFSFAYVPAVKPHQRRLPQADLPSGAAKLRLFAVTEEVLGQAGYVPVGMDHFALPEDELAQAAARGALARDFQGYTVERAPDTVGLGVSAISSFRGFYAQNTKSLRAHRQAVFSGRLATERGMWVGEEDRRRGDLIEQVMCNFRAPIPPGERGNLEPLVSDGLVELAGDQLVVTRLGRRFVRNVAMALDPRVRRTASFSRTV